MFKHKLLKQRELESITTDSGRFYTTPDGKKYPSVTTVIGKSADKTWLWEWHKRVGKEKAAEITRRATTRGTKIHKMFEKYLMNENDYLEEDTMPINKIMFNEMKSIVDQNIDEIYGVEHPLYSHRLKTAGRTDAIAKFAGIPSIVDFKTASYPKEESDITDYFLQCTCYALMAGELENIHIPQIAILICVQNYEPQVFIKKTIDYVPQVVKLFKNYNSSVHSI